MSKYKAGDKLIVYIDGFGVISDKAYEKGEMEVEVIGSSKNYNEDLVCLPASYKGSASTIMEHDVTALRLNTSGYSSVTPNPEKYLGKKMIWIYPDNIKGISNVNKSPMEDGSTCTRCKQFSQYAVANQPDGTFKCYGCRTNMFA